MTIEKTAIKTPEKGPQHLPVQLMTIEKNSNKNT